MLLKYRARSKGEFVSRLKQKKYPSSVIEEAIRYLEENNYINDKIFSDLYVAYSFEKGWGPRRIDFNLEKLGISSQLRGQVLNKNLDYGKKIREAIERKVAFYKKSKVSQEKICQKIVRLLLAKGFSHKDIFQEMDSLGVSKF